MLLAINVITWVIILAIFLKVIIQITIDKSFNFPFLGFNPYKFFLPLKREEFSNTPDRVIRFTNLLLILFYSSFIVMSILIIIYAATMYKR